MLSVPSVAMIGGTPPTVITSPLKLPKHAAEGHAQQDREQQRHLRVLRDHKGDHHGDQADHGTNGQVNAAGDDHHGLGQGHDGQHGDIEQDVAKVVQREEVGAAQTHHQNQHNDEDADAHFAELGQREEDA